MNLIVKPHLDIFESIDRLKSHGEDVSNIGSNEYKPHTPDPRHITKFKKDTYNDCKNKLHAFNGLKQICR